MSSFLDALTQIIRDMNEPRKPLLDGLIWNRHIKNAFQDMDSLKEVLRDAIKGEYLIGMCDVCKSYFPVTKMTVIDNDTIRCRHCVVILKGGSRNTLKKT